MVALVSKHGAAHAMPIETGGPIGSQGHWSMTLIATHISKFGIVQSSDSNLTAGNLPAGADLVGACHR